MSEIFVMLKTFEWTSLMGILLYWIPMSLCTVGYTVRTWSNYQSDVKKREAVEKNNADWINRFGRDSAEYRSNSKYYTPTDTIGSLIGRGIASIVPLINIWCAMFDVAPKMFGKFFNWIDKVFNQPLVPERDI